MNHRITSDRLRTIEDVHREQWLVDEELERQRCLLCYDREQIEEVLSPDYWLDILSRRAAGIVESATSRFASGIRGISSGAGMLGGLVGRLTRGLFQRQRRPAGEYYYIIEEEYDE